MLLEVRALHRRQSSSNITSVAPAPESTSFSSSTLPLAEVEVRRGGLDALIGASHDLRAGGVGEAAQLV